MKLRPLGSTGILISPLSLGTVKLGRNQAVKYPRPFDLPSDEDARALLCLAADLGINLLDTAPAYGSSEARLGSLLADMPSHFLISTKVGEEFESTLQGPRSRYDFSPAHTRASIERSLKRLRRETLDIVLVHSDGCESDPLSDDPLPLCDPSPPCGGGGRVCDGRGRCVPLDALDTLIDLKAEGKVRAIGFSPKTPTGARAALPLSDVLMLTLNAAKPAMLSVVQQAHAAGVGVLIKKGLSSGHLPALPHSTASPDPIESALTSLLTEPGVSSVVVGTINPDHLQHNVAAAERALRE